MDQQSILIPSLEFNQEEADINYEDIILNSKMSISPRDKLSFVEDKKLHKEMKRFLDKNQQLNMLTRILKTEIIRSKPESIINFINDVFFSLENQTRLRNVLRN